MIVVVVYDRSSISYNNSHTLFIGGDVDTEVGDDIARNADT